MFADSVLAQTPLVTFTLLLLSVLVVPPIFERLQLPGLVGLLVAGVLLGPSVLGLLNPEAETMDLLSDVGKIYLMFVAGLEIDLADFRRTKERSLAFGLATFCFPMTGGILVGHFIAGLGWNASILVGSLLASHTLLGFPIVSRLGLTRNEAVTVTIGATIFTDVAALMVLAICLSVHASGQFSLLELIRLLTILGMYTLVVLVGVDKVGRAFFRRTGDEDSNQFLFVLLVVFLAAIAAELLQIEKIVGAFLAGLAVNDVVGRGPVAEKIEFVGSTLFIPFFFVGMGLLLDLESLRQTLTQALGVSLAVVATLLLTKFLAAATVGRWFRYSSAEMMTMWSLSIPQVAATLAAALAGVKAGLLPIGLFNAVILMMLVTSIVGPILTNRFARQLLAREITKFQGDRPAQAVPSLALLPSGPLGRMKVLLPVYNPETEANLLKIGASVIHANGGQLIPLAIAPAHVHMDAPELDEHLAHSHQLLDQAKRACHELGVPVSPRLRIDGDVALGITRTAKEEQCSLIVMGASPDRWLSTWLFSTVIDQVIWSTHCPVMVARLLDNPDKWQRILLTVKWLTPQDIVMIRLTLQLVAAQQGSLEILHIYGEGSEANQGELFERALRHHVELPDRCSVRTVRNNDTAPVIFEAAQSADLVVVGFNRRRTAGGLAVGDVTTQVLRQLSCSTILFGMPHS